MIAVNRSAITRTAATYPEQSAKKILSLKVIVGIVVTIDRRIP